MKRVAVGLAFVLSAAMAGRADAADEVRGKAVFDVFCVGCHAAARPGGGGALAGTFVLQERYQGKVPAALEERPDLAPAFIKNAVRRGVATPKKPDAPGTIMPPIRKTEITDEDLDNLVAYLTRRKS